MNKVVTILSCDDQTVLSDRFQANQHFTPVYKFSFSIKPAVLLNGEQQKRNLKLMENHIQCITVFNCFVCNTYVTKPSPCFPLPPIDLVIGSMFQPLKFIPTI